MLLFLPQGKVEVELALLSIEEAEKSPAGLGREEPDALGEPKYDLLLFSHSFICSLSSCPSNIHVHPAFVCIVSLHRVKVDL